MSLRRRSSFRSIERLENRDLMAGLASHLISAVDNPAPGIWSSFTGAAGQLLTPITGMTVAGNNHATVLPVNFDPIPDGNFINGTAKRAYWDYQFSSPQNLLGTTNFQFNVYAPTVSPMSQLAIYFRSGSDDWYRYVIPSAELNSTTWKTITIDLKTGFVENGGAVTVPGWSQITAVRFSAVAGPTEQGDASFAISDFKAGGRGLIDSFNYASAPASAAANWVAASYTPASGPATAASIAGKNATRFPVNFQTSLIGERAIWERTFDLDLSWARGVEFDIYSDNVNPISSLTFYFRSGNGWYRSNVNLPNVGSWNHVKLDMAEAAVELGNGGEPPAGWSQIDLMRISAWRGTNTNTSFALSNLKVFGGPQEIDGFHYPTDAAARSVWTATPWTSQGDVAIDENQTGGHALNMPVRFQGAVNGNPLYDRANWDAQLNFGLSGSRGIQFDIKVNSLASISGFGVYLKSGAGWYTHYIDKTELTGGVWKTIVIHRETMQTEGDPEGWETISGIRFSVWRNASVTGTNTNVFLRDVRSIAPDVLIVRQDGVDDVWAANVARQLSSSGIPFAGMSDRDVTAQRIEPAGLVVLPYFDQGGAWPLSPSAVTAIAAAITNGSVKYLGFYNAPVEILNALRMTGGNYYAAGYPFAEIHVNTTALPGSPAVVKQASYNIVATNPIVGQSSLYATWHNASGAALNDPQGNPLPAIVGSDYGIMMTHVLLGDDLENKGLMLTAMTDKLVAGQWAVAATEAVSRIGQVSSYKSFSAARSAIEATATANGTSYRVARYFDTSAGAATTLRAAAEAALGSGNYPAAYGLALQAREALRKAYSAAEVPLAGEMRAFFAHDAFPPAGQTWDSTIKKLAESGINTIAVNLLTGGGTYYNTAITVPGINGTPAFGAFPNLSGGVDQLALLAAATEKYGLDLYAWKTNWQLLTRTPQQQAFRDWMNSQGRLQVDAFGGTINALDPSIPANRDLEVATMVEVAKKIGIKGILFDYIRFDGGNSSFSPASKAAFETHLGVTLPADWRSLVQLGGTYYNQWIAWRQSLITDVVQRTSTQVRIDKPNVKITAAVFANWIVDKNTIGQDWVSWLNAGYLDFAVPMDYNSSNAGFDASIVNQKSWTGGKPFYPAIGLSSTGNNMPSDQVIDQIKITRQRSTGGFFVFNLAADELNRIVPTLGLGTTSAAPFQESLNTVSIEAENYQSRSAGLPDTWSVIANSTASGGKAILAGPDNGSIAGAGVGTKVEYKVYFPAFAAQRFFNLYVRGLAPNTNGDQLDVSVVSPTGAVLSLYNVTLTGAANTWNWRMANNSTTRVPIAAAGGVYTIRVRMREDGVRLDKVVLSTSTALPTGNGPVESLRMVVAGQYGVPLVAAPMAVPLDELEKKRRV